MAMKNIDKFVGNPINCLLLVNQLIYGVENILKQITIDQGLISNITFDI